MGSSSERPNFDNKGQLFRPRTAYIGNMRRIVRRTDTVVTVQVWTVTWAEDVPASEPARVEARPALPSGPPPEAPAATPETPRPLPAPDRDAE